MANTRTTFNTLSFGWSAISGSQMASDHRIAIAQTVHCFANIQSQTVQKSHYEKERGY